MATHAIQHRLKHPLQLPVKGSSVVRMLLVAMPGAPSSDALAPSSFLLLVVRPGAPSSVLGQDQLVAPLIFPQQQHALGSSAIVKVSEQAGAAPKDIPPGSHEVPTRFQGSRQVPTRFPRFLQGSCKVPKVPKVPTTLFRNFAPRFPQLCSKVRARFPQLCCKVPTSFPQLCPFCFKVPTRFPQLFCKVRFPQLCTTRLSRCQQHRSTTLPHKVLPRFPQGSKVPTTLSGSPKVPTALLQRSYEVPTILFHKVPTTLFHKVPTTLPHKVPPRFARFPQLCPKVPTRFPQLCSTTFPQLCPTRFPQGSKLPTILLQGSQTKVPTALLQGCPNVPTALLQGSHKVSTTLPHKFPKVPTRLLQGSHNFVARHPLRFPHKVPPRFPQCCFTSFQQSAQGSHNFAPRLPQGSHSCVPRFAQGSHNFAARFPEAAHNFAHFASRFLQGSRNFSAR